MKEAFSSKLGLSTANTERLGTINDIIEEYQADGYVLTLRQLYYQLVSRDIIPNNVKEYAKLSTLLTKGRMAGIVDWAAIQDRGRKPQLPYWVTGIPDALNDILQQYRLDRQQGQRYYIEVWVEKDALSNIFLRVTEEFHIHLMVNKGYSSSSAMYDAAQRFKRNGQQGRRPSVLLYFGDHDASGKDMVRDIRERLEEFRVKNLIVTNPALTMEQIRQYDPPENPAKLTDPRAKWYINEYGEHSWELDALPPRTLSQIIRDAVLDYLEPETFNAMVELEEQHKERIQEMIDQHQEGDHDN